MSPTNDRPGTAGAGRGRPSLLGMGAAGRLVGALAISAALWVAVWWAS
jgi:hypothetical protein